MSHLKFLRQFDSRPSQFNPTFSRHTEYKSEVGGLISLACKLMLVFFLVLKSWQLISRQSRPSYSMKVIKQNDMNQLTFSDADIRIQIQANSIDNITKKQTKDLLSFVDLPLYGLEASYATHEAYDDPNTSGDYELDMVNCQNSSKWFCIPGTANKTVIGNNQFVYSNEKGCILRKNSIIISKCEKGKLINGKPCEQINPNRLFKFIIVLKNKEINPEQLSEIDLVKSQQKHRILQTHHLISSNYSLYFTIFLNRVTISTDNSIMPTIFNPQPKYHNVTSWFYDELKNEQLILEGDKDTLLKIDIKRSIYTHQYYRKYQRVDAMLGQVLGFIGFVSILLFFFYQGYNDWCFQQIVREQLGYSYSPISLLNYYRWRIKWLASKICCCFTRNSNNRIDRSRQWQQIIERIDYLQILKRVENLKQKKGSATESQLYEKQEDRTYKIGTNIQMSGTINIEDNENKNRNTDMGRTMYTVDQTHSYADIRKQLCQSLISNQH